MFPAMIQPGVQEYIDKYGSMDGVLAWKMPGAGGGGYLALVCASRSAFPPAAIPLTIRRPGMYPASLLSLSPSAARYVIPSP
jgi:hypothetical protein